MYATLTSLEYRQKQNKNNKNNTIVNIFKNVLIIFYIPQVYISNNYIWHNQSTQLQQSLKTQQYNENVNKIFKVV